MRGIRLSAALVGMLATLPITQLADARVTRFVVEERVPFAEDTTWGTAGEYERLKGTAYMEVDPNDPLNSVIVDLENAPRNDAGMVEFSSPFLILKPTDMERGNHKLWMGLNNRGNCIELSLRAFGRDATSTCNPLTADDVGEDNTILQHGFAFVDVGWHGDGLPSPEDEQLYPDFPVATEADGSPIVGPLRLEYQPTEPTFSRPLVSGWQPYETASTDTADSTLTVRDRQGAPEVEIPPDQWAFGECPDGPDSLVPTTTDICLFDGFAANKIYELVYPAKDPIVMGLAYAVTRDIGSFLRYETHDDYGNPNPLALSSTSTGIRRAYSSGTSSTGMYQREFLYLGFNEDEAHRQVFDAVTIYSAATHRLFANTRFAHPTFYSRQDRNQDYTSNSLPPFTFAVTTDPVTGIRDGILKRPETDPLVLQIDEELVFWQWKASLNVVDSAGTPVPTPDNVRLYLMDGFGHISGSGLLSPPNPSGSCQHQTHGGESIALTPRALVSVIDDWADNGIEPPRNNYPRKHQLVSLAEYRAGFPSIPGVDPPVVFNELNVYDWGEMFGPQGGVKTVQPPNHGQPYTVLVPAAGKDGDAVAGIDTMMTRAPLGTNVGWNIREAPRAPDLCGLDGAFFPFAETRAERLAMGDSRKSLEERYRDHDGFVRAVRKAASQLVRERFLLPQDAERFVEAAEASDLLPEADRPPRGKGPGADVPPNKGKGPPPWAGSRRPHDERGAGRGRGGRH